MLRKIWGVVLVIAGALGFAVAAAGSAAAGVNLANHYEP
jgi:hypothetical protein